MERLYIRVTGRVQGVFFRAHTQEVASKLGLVGWVRNTDDGDVEAVAEGERAPLERFRDWCRRGPSMAQVTHLEERWEASTGEFSRFDISYARGV
jgi:acylphosphatase